MSIVYIVQNQQMKSLGGELVPRFDYSAAEKFGELVFLLSDSLKPSQTETIKEDLHEKLKDFTKDDYILFVGNPMMIGMAATVACYYSGGGFKALQWHGYNGEYVVLEVENLIEYEEYFEES